MAEATFLVFVVACAVESPGPSDAAMDGGAPTRDGAPDGGVSAPDAADQPDGATSSDWGGVENGFVCEHVIMPAFLERWNALECTHELGFGPSITCGEVDDDGCWDPGEPDACAYPDDGAVADGGACVPEPACTACSGADVARCLARLDTRDTCSDLAPFGCTVRCRP